MELKELYTFVAVAEACAFRRAASYMQVEQSALSRRVRRLEDGLGVSLLERHRSGVRLTVAGAQFLDDTRTVISYLNTAVRRVSAAGQAREGILKIAVVASISSSFGNELLRRFRAAHPKVVIEIAEGDPGEHVAAIQARLIDLAFVTGTRQVMGCDAEALWIEPILAALPDDDPRARANSLDLVSLSSEVFIVSRAAPGPEIHDYIVQRLALLGFSPRIDYQSVTREGLMSLVGLKFGVSLVSGAEAGVNYPHVVFVPLAGETLPFSAVWSAENDNPALRRMLSLARGLSRRRRTDVVLSRTPDPSP